MTTDLYRRTIAFDLGNSESNELMRKVWEPTPWMVDVYTGGGRDPRDEQIRRWCYDEFGEESSPIHGTPGYWRRGNATVHGWTWYGFASGNHMHCFLAAWPTPEGITHPDAKSGGAALGASSAALGMAGDAPIGADLGVG